MAKNESKRQLQVAELIRRNLGMVLQQEGSYIYGAAFVTVTEIRVTPDLSQAKAYLSVFNADDKLSVIQLIEASQRKLQQSLYQRVKKHIRRMPVLEYYIDDTLDEMYKVDHLFQKLEDENQMGTDKIKQREDEINPI
ncbi:MAG: ribosome-binding factor A, partial [Saprospiraceae bacterium]